MGKYWPILEGSLVTVNKSYVFANWCFLKLGSCFGAWETAVLSFLMITFQRNGSQVLEKDIPVLQNGPAA